MPAEKLEILVEVPERLSRHERKNLTTAAFEGAVLHLFDKGKISGRVAASRLGKTHYDFLEYAGQKGIPMVRTYDTATVEKAVRQPAQGKEAPPMIAVLDSSVVIGLAKGRVFVRLRELPYEFYTVPGVRKEIVHGGRGRPGSAALSRAIRNGWVQVQDPSPSGMAYLPSSVSSTDFQLLALSIELSASYLCTDDLELRREAGKVGIPVLGYAHLIHLLCLNGSVARAKPVFDLMRKRDFGIIQRVYQQLLLSLGESP